MGPVDLLCKAFVDGDYTRNLGITEVPSTGLMPHAVHARALDREGFRLIGLKEDDVRRLAGLQ
jgi:hypothetical protein